MLGSSGLGDCMREEGWGSVGCKGRRKRARMHERLESVRVWGGGKRERVYERERERERERARERESERERERARARASERERERTEKRLFRAVIAPI